MLQASAHIHSPSTIPTRPTDPSIRAHARTHERSRTHDRAAHCRYAAESKLSATSVLFWAQALYASEGIVWSAELARSDSGGAAAARIAALASIFDALDDECRLAAGPRAQATLWTHAPCVVCRAVHVGVRVHARVRAEARHARTLTRPRHAWARWADRPCPTGPLTRRLRRALRSKRVAAAGRARAHQPAAAGRVGSPRDRHGVRLRALRVRCHVRRPLFRRQQPRHGAAPRACSRDHAMRAPSLRARLVRT